MNKLERLLQIEQTKKDMGKNIYYHFAAVENVQSIFERGFVRTGEVQEDTSKINSIIKDVLGEDSFLYRLRERSFYFANVATNPKFTHNEKIVYVTGWDEEMVYVLDMDKANDLYYTSSDLEMGKLEVELAVKLYEQSIVPLKNYDGSYATPEYLYFGESISVSNLRKHYEEITLYA